jgi:hypothetical protein
MAALYDELSRLSHGVCSGCEVPYHCCEQAGCAQAAIWARAVHAVELAPGTGRLPFLSDTGCIVAPHYRMLCTLWLCPDGIGRAPKRFFELREAIVLEEGKRLAATGGGVEWKTTRRIAPSRKGSAIS